MTLRADFALPTSATLPRKVEVQASRVTVAPAPQVRMTIDQIPKPLCWALLGVSAATLIIQIWSYFS